MKKSNKESILIFGAGLNQLTIISAAQNLGFFTIAIDPEKNAPGKNQADTFFCVAGNDFETTKQIAQKYGVKGIVTSQMEKPMRLMVRLAQDLGYIFHTSEIVERSLNKYLMKKTFIANNIPCAKGRLFSLNEDITQDSISAFKFPIIIKPKDAFSSRGVYKIDRYEEISNYIAETRSFASNGDILVEEFLQGPEYSVESITYKGHTTIIQYTEKFLTPFPNLVEIGHLQPAALTDEHKNEINLVVKSAIDAIGIDNSASHCEIIISKGGVKVLEIGARLGGDFISSYLTLASTGINMDRAVVQVSVGLEPELEARWEKYSYIKYFQLPERSLIHSVDNVDDLVADENVILASIYVKEGDVIPALTHSGERSGFVIVSGDSRDEVIEKASYVETEIIKRIRYTEK